VGKIPCDPQFTRAQVMGMSLVDLGDGLTLWAVQDVWEQLVRALEGER
jgi:hypothetical protein